ncbi:MAG: hypothetical protein CVU46_17660 [Chloroflexi bacterium HGW-Chloroflexi-8]|nr:MAG: hypothetical protein CVU46_17660 [Chloroflexi bacterium HGW-Chloroflexi-8]
MNSFFYKGSGVNVLVLVILLGFVLTGCNFLPALNPSVETGTPSPVPSLITQTAPNPALTKEPLVLEDFDLFQPGLVKSQHLILEKLKTANQYDLKLFVATDRKSINVEQVLRMNNQENIPLMDLYFHLFANYSGGKIVFSQILINGQEANYQLEAEDTILHIKLVEPLPVGESLVVTMLFDIQIPTVMGGNYGIFGYFDSVLVLDTFYPMLAVYDADGWHNQKPDPVGDLSYTDASFYLVSVDFPAELVAVSSGLEIENSAAGDRTRSVFAIGPARDFYLALSEDYIKVSEQVGEVLVNSYARPSEEDGANIALDAAVHALNIFSSYFGDYPYTELDVISSPMQAMGIEYPGIVGIGINLYELDQKTGRTLNPDILESVVVHEVAHQWFYNLVGNDQVNEPWLDESVSQFATGIYYEERYSATVGEQYRTSWMGRWNRIQQEKIPIGLPVSAYDAKTYSPIIYGRGPYFLFELEKTLGSDLNAQFWKKYVAKNQWQNSTTSAFQKLAEEECGCQLGDLFIDWVYEVE